MKEELKAVWNIWKLVLQWDAIRFGLAFPLGFYPIVVAVLVLIFAHKDPNHWKVILTCLFLGFTNFVFVYFSLHQYGRYILLRYLPMVEPRTEDDTGTGYWFEGEE